MSVDGPRCATGYVPGLPFAAASRRPMKPAEIVSSSAIGGISIAVGSASGTIGGRASVGASAPQPSSTLAASASTLESGNATEEAVVTTIGAAAGGVARIIGCDPGPTGAACEITTPDV